MALTANRDPLQTAGPGPEAARNIRGGSLDDTSWLRPTVHFWTCYKQPWVVLPEGDQCFETQPADMRAFLLSAQPG
jgi:hypothetical protein